MTAEQTPYAQWLKQVDAECLRRFLLPATEIPNHELVQAFGSNQDPIKFAKAWGDRLDLTDVVEEPWLAP
jgi:hypothetical protein